MNKNNGIYFLNLKIDAFRCFSKSAVLNLSDEKGNWKQWTVLLGNNGTGKTSVLQLLAGFETTEVDIPGPSSSEQKVKIAKGFDRFLENFENANANVLIYNQKDYLFFGGDGISIWAHETDIVCYGYGANRFMSLNALSESKSENSETL